MSSKNISVNLTESTLKLCGRQRSVSSRLNCIADRYALIVEAVGATLRSELSTNQFDAIAAIVLRPDFPIRDVAVARHRLEDELADQGMLCLVHYMTRAEFVVLLELVEAQS
jgi:hypothetical protein